VESPGRGNLIYYSVERHVDHDRPSRLGKVKNELVSTVVKGVREGEKTGGGLNLLMGLGTSENSLQEGTATTKGSLGGRYAHAQWNLGLRYDSMDFQDQGGQRKKKQQEIGGNQEMCIELGKKNGEKKGLRPS